MAIKYRAGGALTARVFMGAIVVGGEHGENGGGGLVEFIGRGWFFYRKLNLLDSFL